METYNYMNAYFALQFFCSNGILSTMNFYNDYWIYIYGFFSKILLISQGFTLFW